MKDGANLSLVILIAYPALLGGMLAVDVLLLIIAFFTGGWWLFVASALGTGGFVAWRQWMMAKLN